MGLQTEFVLPIHAEVSVIAEARLTANREVVLDLPRDTEGGWHSRRRALTYFITRLSEKELIKRIDGKIMRWSTCALATFASGYTLMITRHQAITGRGPTEPLIWGAIQLVSMTALCFFLREEQIRANEHRWNQLENYVLESNDPKSPRNAAMSRLTEFFAEPRYSFRPMDDDDDDIYRPSTINLG